MKKFLVCLLSSAFLSGFGVLAASTPSAVLQTIKAGETMNLNSSSACLMEYSTGEILFEKNSEEHFEPASVTKIMSVLLIEEALDNGSLKKDDIVTASNYAASMGGSQIWLEYGEQFTVDEMLKAIMIVSANDCTVAMAEHLAGSEETFVAMMNERAKELSMNNTNFVNCTGLPEENHYSCAKDIAIMTRELLKHPDILNYTTIWMDSLRNNTMGLVNTNKLIRFYKGATGMKTGYTQSAGYCLSGTAQKNDMQLIAAVMKAESSDKRFEDAKKLLDYGFANFTVFNIDDMPLDPIPVKGSSKASVNIKNITSSVLLPKGKEKSVETVTSLPEYLTAPVHCGDVIGSITYAVSGEEIAKSDIIAAEDAEKITFTEIFLNILKKTVMIR